MVNLAISTHRKAVGKAIGKIGEAYLQLQAQQKIVEAQKELLPLGKELVDYWQKVEAVDGRQGVSLNLAIQHQRELELKLEQTKMKEIMQRTQLKILAGVEPQQRLEVDTKSADTVLAGFDGHKLTWEDRWPATEDELLLRGQVKLSDYNIMVAWAQYIAVNNSPPSGQYQPVNGKEDTFLHLTFDFPLIDWGRRYRGVQTARMNKAQAFHELARNRTDYSNKWLQCEQRVALAETERKLAKTRLDTASMQFKEAQISFHEGIVQLPDVATKQEDMVQARIAYITADLDYKLAMLEWMNLSNSLSQRFLGLPAKEVL
jgi:outer membrane protein TolC